MAERLTSYFARTPEQKQLMLKLQQLQVLQRCYAQLAPPSLRQASRLIGARHQHLLIAAENGAVAAKLRQITPELTRLFQAAGHEVTGIQIRVQVGVSSPQAKNPPRRLAPQNKHQLSELAKKIEPGPLKEAILRLIARSG